MDMKRTLLLLLGLGAATLSAAGEQKVKTSVEQVTLFIDGAQVTRSRQIDLPAGNSTVVFTGLSPYLDDKSMQVSAKGPFTVTAVNRVFNHTDSLERSTRRQALEQEIDKTQQQLNRLKASRELKSKALSLDAEEEKINERRRQILAELVNLGGKQSVPMSEVEVRIEAPAACRGSFTLTYYVRNAGWFPSYDIRSGGLSEPVEISYKANIFQNTKEEWKNVALTLSSSNPTTGSIAPQLRTWWLDYGLAPPRYNLNLTSNTVSGIVFDEQREPLPGATSLQFSYVGYTPRTERITGNSMNVTMQEDATALDEAVVVGYGVSNQLAGAAPGVRIRGTAASDRKVVEVDFADFDAESAVMEVEQTQNQLGYEFEIRQPYTIPSDGKSVAAEIGRFDLPAAYIYQSTPKIDKDAFLVAEATGWEKLNLLQGEANVYFENTFVGKSILDPGQTSDTLRFSMGRDRSIRIERTKENDYSSRRAIGSNQTQTVAWKFTVRNTRPEPVVLTLTDQLPVSRNSTIAVSAEELSGGRLDKESGIVAWRLELKPGEQRELHLRYAVKYPKGRSLAIE